MRRQGGLWRWMQVNVRRQTAPRGRRRLHALSEQLAGVTAGVRAPGCCEPYTTGRAERALRVLISQSLIRSPFASTPRPRRLALCARSALISFSSPPSLFGLI